MSDTNNPTQAELDAIEAEADAILDADTGAESDNSALDQVIAEREEWKDRALRAAAEADNVRRRTENQLNDARAFAIQRFAKDLLGVADNLSRPLQAAPKDAEGAAAGLVIGLLDGVNAAQGVRIFIGAETRLFSLSGSAVIAAPYMNGRQRVLGAIGVIGPARLNYARIIPLVDYTARVLGRMLDGQDT